MSKIVRQITSDNIDENFLISFLKLQNEDGEESYLIQIIDTKTEQIETAKFYTEDAAKEVYCNFINWSIKGMHTFEQRVMLLKELEEYYNKTKFNSRNEK